MPRGGARVGAGRKRKTPRAHWLTGDAGKRGLALVESPAVDAATHHEGDGAAQPEGASSFAPPASLSDEERTYWEEWEPKARANGTLTQATLPGFVLPCQVKARHAAIAKEIAEQGLMIKTLDGEKAHPLLVREQNLWQRLDQLLKSYGLSAMGKPAAASPPVNDEKLELRRLLAIS